MPSVRALLPAVLALCCPACDDGSKAPTDAAAAGEDAGRDAAAPDAAGEEAGAGHDAAQADASVPVGDASADTGPDSSAPNHDAGGGNATGETVFLSVGGDDNTPWLYTSCDGQGWTRRTVTLPPDHPTGGEGSGLRGIGYGDGLFVITGGGTVSGRNVRLIGRSSDARSWQWEESPSCRDCQWMGGAAWLDDGKGGVWIAGGGTGARLYSLDGGRTWSESAEQGIAPYRRLRNAGARAAAAGQGVISVIELAPAGSPEPVRWHDSDGPPHESVFLAAGNGAIVAVWYDDGCRWLREGTSWQRCNLPAGRDPVITSVAFGNGKFSILGHGAPIESSDGEHWTLAPSGDGTDFRDVAFDDGTYTTPGSYSSDARAWRSASPGAEHGAAMAAGPLTGSGSCPR